MNVSCFKKNVQISKFSKLNHYETSHQINRQNVYFLVNAKS